MDIIDTTAVDEAFDLTYAIALNPPDVAKGTPVDWNERGPLVNALLIHFDDITEVSRAAVQGDYGESWYREQIAGSIGCEHPDPLSWVESPINVLEKSEPIVRLLRDTVCEVVELQGESASTAFCVAWPALELGCGALRSASGNVELARQALFGRRELAALGDLHGVPEDCHPTPLSAVERLAREHRGDAARSVREFLKSQAAHQDGTKKVDPLIVERDADNDDPPASPDVRRHPRPTQPGPSSNDDDHGHTSALPPSLVGLLQIVGFAAILTAVTLVAATSERTGVAVSFTIGVLALVGAWLPNFTTKR